MVVVVQYVHVDVHVDHIHTVTVPEVNATGVADDTTVIVVIVVGEKIAVVDKGFPQKIPTVAVAVVVGVVVVFLAAGIAAATAAVVLV